MRGECIFLISDGYQLIGEQAMSMCAKAEPFTEDCLRHKPRLDVEMKSYDPDACHTATNEIDAQGIYGTVQRYLPPDF